MNDTSPNFSKKLKQELAVLVGLLFIGVVVLPVLVWFVGQAVFGSYGGQGYMDFLGSLTGKLTDLEAAARFLVLSPWITWQTIRLLVFAWRKADKM